MADQGDGEPQPQRRARKPREAGDVPARNRRARQRRRPRRKRPRRKRLRRSARGEIARAEATIRGEEPARPPTRSRRRVAASASDPTMARPRATHPPGRPGGRNRGKRRRRIAVRGQRDTDAPGRTAPAGPRPVPPSGRCFDDARVRAAGAPPGSGTAGTLATPARQAAARGAAVGDGPSAAGDGCASPAAARRRPRPTRRGRRGPPYCRDRDRSAPGRRPPGIAHRADRAGRSGRQRPSRRAAEPWRRRDHRPGPTRSAVRVNDHRPRRRALATPAATTDRPGRPGGPPRPRPGPYRQPGFRPPPPPDPNLLGPDEELVAGRRPVEEAFVASGRPIRLLVVPQRRQALERLVLHATSLRIPIVEVEGGTLTALAGFDGHQGIALVVGPRRWSSVDEILARGIERGEPAFVLVLDSLEDPQNVGTLLRSAEAAGVHGVVFPTHRQAPLTPCRGQGLGRARSSTCCSPRSTTCRRPERPPHPGRPDRRAPRPTRR